ncbi:hypothetical protein AB3N59_14240 [Leptospira sp. WS92.C1]
MKLYFLFVILFLFHPLFSESSSGEKKIEILIPDGNSGDNNGWGKNPLQFEDIDFLGDAGEENSKSFFDKSKEGYLNAVDRFRKATDLAETKRKDFDQRTFEADRYEWQKRNRRENFENSLTRDINKARSDSVRLLVASMNFLERIQNQKIRDSDHFRELQAGIYREYIKHQLAFRNYMQAMDLLERYIQIGSKYYEDSEAQGYLATCYERIYRLSKKTRDNQARDKYDVLRKKHGLLYAEFKFGKDSSDYKEFSRELFRD